ALELSRIRYYGGKIAGAPRQFPNRQGMAGGAFPRPHDFPHGKPVAIAAIEDAGLAAVSQMLERKHVRGNEVADMDIVAHARAVGRGIIRAVYAQMRMPAQSDLAGPFDKMGGLRGRLPGAPIGVGAGHVEITQDDVAE